MKESVVFILVIFFHEYSFICHSSFHVYWKKETFDLRAKRKLYFTDFDIDCNLQHVHSNQQHGQLFKEIEYFIFTFNFPETSVLLCFEPIGGGAQHSIQHLQEQNRNQNSPQIFYLIYNDRLRWTS